jgi:prophage regulatory protein
MSPIHVSKAPHRRPAIQPLQVAQQSGTLLKKATVSAVTGLSASTIERKIAEGKFPRPVKLGARCVRFPSDAVQAWIAEQVAA